MSNKKVKQIRDSYNDKSFEEATKSLWDTYATKEEKEGALPPEHLDEVLKLFDLPHGLENVAGAVIGAMIARGMTKEEILQHLSITYDGIMAFIDRIGSD